MRQEERFQRQLDLIDMGALQELPITIIGCGAIGSYTAWTLAKMGAHNLELWDGDEVEPHNLSNQMFPMNMLGENKAEGMGELLEEWEEIEIDAHAEMFEDGEVSEVTIFAVDSIEVREQIWEDSVRMNPDCKLLLDARMSAEVAELHIADPPYKPTPRDRYEDTLCDPEETIDVPCTAQTTMYCAGAIGALLAGAVKKYVEDEDIPVRSNIDLVNYNII